MTIQEAIKSGRPFKRGAWRDIDWVNQVNRDVFKFTVEDILATDWEIEVGPISFTLQTGDRMEPHFNRAFLLLGKPDKVKVTVEVIE